MPEGKKPDVVVKKDEPLTKEDMVQSPVSTGKVEVKGKEVELSAADKVLAEARKILEQYNNQETNIPVGDKYWILMNQYRGMVTAEKG